MQIIAGSSNRDLAKKVAAYLGLEILYVQVTKFSDGELKVIISGNIDDEVTIIHSTAPAVNDNLIELLLLADILKRNGAKNIRAIIPYFGYSRQNHTYDKNSSIAANVIIKMIESAGIAEVTTLDLHSCELENIFDIPLNNLKTNDIFLPQIQKQKNIMNNNIIIISPDISGIERAKNYATLLDVEFAIANKIREDGQCLIKSLEGNVRGKNCIIIDDIVDKADTICATSELLLSMGAKNIEAYVTHGVFSGDALKKIQESALSHLHITDSIPHHTLSDKVSVLSACRLLASVI